MKWFQHKSDARNDVKLKKLKSRFGAEGYGVYFQLLEIVSEYIETDNLQDWGLVDPEHDLDTLASECGVSRKRLVEILTFCNEINLLHKIEGRLCIPRLLRRLDKYSNDYAGKQQDFNLREREQQLFSRVKPQDGKSLTSNGEVTEKNVVLDKIRRDKSIGKEETGGAAKKQTETEYKQWLRSFNQRCGTEFSSLGSLSNFEYWRKFYSFEEMLKAIDSLENHDWLKDKKKPELVLRRTDTHKNPVDRIGELLSTKPQWERL